jgi:hypothetical protein
MRGKRGEEEKRVLNIWNKVHQEMLEPEVSD